jgi:hypothetical protein
LGPLTPALLTRPVTELLRGVEEPVDVGLVGGVDADGDAAAPGLAHGRGDGLGGSGVGTVAEDDVMAVRGQACADRGADPPAAAGDHGDGLLVHGGPPECVDLDDSAVGIDELVVSRVEWRVGGGPVDGQAQAQGTGQAAGAGRVELEDRAVREDGGVVPGPLTVLLGDEVQAEARIEGAALLQL